jgi:hypothetical protein
MAQQLSKDKKRGITDEAVFGIPAYEVDEDGNGKHVGIFKNEEDARSWLETGLPKPRKVYSHEPS